MVDGEHAVELTDLDGKTHVLNRYWTRTTYPRPESYKEDLSSSLDAVSERASFWSVYDVYKIRKMSRRCVRCSRPLCFGYTTNPKTYSR